MTVQDAALNNRRNSAKIVKMTTLDRDEKLIAALRENARLSTAALARRLGLSRSTVQSRIESLERRGVIVGYTVRLSDEYELHLVRASLMLKVDPKKSRAVEAAIRRQRGVRALHTVSGEFDLIADAHTRTIGEMEALIDTLGDVDGVLRTTTSIVLSTKFSR